MTNETTAISLTDKLKLIFDKVPKNKWRYYHKISFQNFIYYLPKMPDTERKDIETIIRDYLDDIDRNSNDADINFMDYSEYLFKTYMAKLIQPYESRLKFVPVFARKAYLIVIPTLVLIFFMAMSNSFVLIVLSILVTLYVSRILNRASKNKIYGFGY